MYKQTPRAGSGEQSWEDPSTHGPTQLAESVKAPSDSERDPDSKHKSGEFQKDDSSRWPLASTFMHK